MIQELIGKSKFKEYEPGDVSGIKSKKNNTKKSKGRKK